MVVVIDQKCNEFVTIVALCLFKLQKLCAYLERMLFVGSRWIDFKSKNQVTVLFLYIKLFLKHSLANNRGWCAQAVSMPKGKYRLPLFIRWLSLEFFSSHCRPQATSGSYRLNVVCKIRVSFKLRRHTHTHNRVIEYVCVCESANKVHCLTVYNRLSEMGIKRGLLHAFSKVCRGLHMLLLRSTNFEWGKLGRKICKALLSI